LIFIYFELRTNKMVKTKKININDYEWYDYHNCYISKKHSGAFFEYYPDQNYSINGELIAIRKRCGSKYDYWGGIDQEGEEWEYVW